MRIVVAPDSFKGTVTAGEVATAIADGWREVRPADELDLLPIADGGEGTLAAFEQAVPGSRRVPVMAVAPDDTPVLAHWLRLPSTPQAPHGTAIVELAAASGLPLVHGALRPFAAHSFGVGQLIADAVSLGVSRVLVGLGGSASTDGGAGALTALGARFTDHRGTPVPHGNVGLAQLERIDLSGLPPLPEGGVIALTDVDNPLLGARGAAAVFGPQKGAVSAGAVAGLDKNLERLVDAAPGGAALAAVAGAGSAGGAAFGLMLWGATLSPGAAAVAEAVGLPARIAAADLVITGEGRYDAQSAGGKAPAHAAALAAASGVPVALVAGSIGGDADVSGFAAALALDDLAGSTQAAMSQGRQWLREAGRRLAVDVEEETA